MCFVKQPPGNQFFLNIEKNSGVTRNAAISPPGTALAFYHPPTEDFLGAVSGPPFSPKPAPHVRTFLVFEQLCSERTMTMNVLRSLLKPVSKMLRVCALALVCLALASPVYADHGDGGDGGDGGGGGGGAAGCGCGGGGGGGAPEIDPNSIAGALTLLSGGVLVLTDKFRRK
jgi:hypothetical protein